MPMICLWGVVVWVVTGAARAGLKHQATITAQKETPIADRKIKKGIILRCIKISSTLVHLLVYWHCFQCTTCTIAHPVEANRVNTLLPVKYTFSTYNTLNESEKPGRDFSERASGTAQAPDWVFIPTHLSGPSPGLRGFFGPKRCHDEIHVRERWLESYTSSLSNCKVFIALW